MGVTETLCGVDVSLEETGVDSDCSVLAAALVWAVDKIKKLALKLGFSFHEKRNFLSRNQEYNLGNRMYLRLYFNGLLGGFLPKNRIL